MKFVKEYISTVIWIGIFSFLVAMMANHFTRIAMPDGPIDNEAIMLGEIKKIIPTGSQVSFATNLSDDEASQGAYYAAQFGWCPMILSDDVSRNDYVIFLRSSAVKDSDMAFLHHCDTLYRWSNPSYALILLHKTKNK